MLVLDRKLGETIRIGPDTVITVCRLTRGHVRIGIDAPREVTVLRGELVDRQEAEVSIRGESIED